MIAMMPEFELLLEKFLRDELNLVELKQFLSTVKEPGNLEKLSRLLDEKLEHKAYSGSSEKPEIDLMFRQMLAKAARKKTADTQAPLLKLAEQYTAPDSTMPSEAYSKKQTGRYSFISRRSIAAAALLFIAGAGAYLWLNRSSGQQQIVRQAPAPVLEKDVEPGGNKAILTLSDGSKISLNNANNGTLAQQGNTTVVKLANGQLSYHASGKTSREILYNTMTTPRGGQYRLSLPDGTQVWLNASSSITYPTSFTGQERKVEIKGEAYFEVAPLIPKGEHKKIPFKVYIAPSSGSEGMEVEVLGTHFNINAYEDESATKTTLLEGAVKIKKGSDAILLKPGQQASCSGNSGFSLMEDADLEESIAWKNGLFSFKEADLTQIMRQLARWYDLDVRYEGTISKRRFTGKVFRNLKLSETLKVLELSHIHFRIEGNRLTVTP
jgi:ferric-dicitrate binding protein FerR (iron transport regulator)